jgi:hypothetical protein
VGYTWQALEATVRYAAILPDRNLLSGTTEVTGGKLINEITPGLTYTHSKNIRIIADLPIMVNAPVATEQNLGDYVLTDQPDQASMLKPAAGATTAVGKVERKNVVAARLMFQGSF